MNRSMLLILLATSFAATACTESSSEPTPQVDDTKIETQSPAEAAESTANADAPKSAREIDGPTLLLAQAQFDWQEEGGKRVPKPGAAKLRVLHLDGGAFEESILEDEDSRVFHKAICVDQEGLEGLLTIGATDAHLKLWTFEDGQWKGESLYRGSYGGKFDRLRDVEIGDVDGDGADEIVIATHDQGVIVVLDREGDAWKATQVYDEADTFVHEIELGDVDGDGTIEIYATPSMPNRANASQDGEILTVRFNPKRKKYVARPVVELEGSHAKEVLVTDLDGDGKDELYGAVEASVKPKDGKLTVDQPVAVKRFDRVKKGWKTVDVAEFPDGLQARVLLRADLTRRGSDDLVVTTMKDGIWRIVPAKDGSFTTEAVDRNSGGFEHAAHAVDLDGDGTVELYVTSDDDDEIRRYVWNGSGFEKTVIGTLDKSDLVWNITSCQ